MRLSRVLLVSVAALLLIALGVVAQQTPPQMSPPARSDANADASMRDPARLSSDVYKVTLDNDRVRVLDITLPKGASVPMHSHPEYIIYAVEDGKARFTMPDGKTEEMQIRQGQTMLRPAESHAVQNIGDTTIHVLNIELKLSGAAPAMTAHGSNKADMTDMAMPAAAHMRDHIFVTPQKQDWVAGPAALPPGVQMMSIEGDPTKPGPFTARFKTPANYTIPPHWHPRDEHVTVLSGTLYMGTGDALDRAHSTALPAGSYAVMPAKMHHFAYADEPVVIQLHGEGPWGITYINPSDDPRSNRAAP
jgi:quercetin dioxygenase-like cupin family protein